MLMSRMMRRMAMMGGGFPPFFDPYFDGPRRGGGGSEPEINDADEIALEMLPHIMAQRVDSHVADNVKLALAYGDEMAEQLHRREGEREAERKRQTRLGELRTRLEDRKSSIERAEEIFRKAGTRLADAQEKLGGFPPEEVQETRRWKDAEREVRKAQTELEEADINLKDMWESLEKVQDELKELDDSAEESTE